MAATESGDGHQRLATNQVPSVQVCGAVTEGTDGESMEVVSEAVATADVGHPELICGSTPGLSEHGGEDNCVAAEKETEHKETEAAVVPSSAFTSPQNPSPSQSSFTDQTFSTALVHGEPGSTSESGKEGTEVKTEEELELKGENVAVKDKSPEESPAGPDVTEDTDMDTTSDCNKEITNTDVNTDPAISTQEEKEAHACKPKVSTADDLDEMMDIGTVDQMEQEAQMKEGEGQSSAMEVESSRSPTTSDTVSAVEESNTVEEETDVKPTVLPPPAQENVKAALDSVQSSSRPSSETMTSAGRRNLSPAAMMNGMKVVKLSIPKLDAERLRAAVQSIKSTPSPPLVKVKDEPVDEEYEQALISSASMASVKDEPNTAKEDLRIGSVFSVTPAAETQMLPTVNPSSMHMFCSHCKKSLMRGQTAFQRKGSSSLFCSTTCLTTSLPTVKGVTKICHNCQKLIFRPQDVILAPDAEGTMKEFCSQNCLTSFNYKKNASNYRRTATTKKPTLAPPSLCSMCTRYCISKHEVILSGAVHKLCGDACFNRFRTVNNLSMAGCANCGSYCHNKPLTLKIDDSNKTLCNAECLAKYKEKTKITQPCSMCRTSHSLAEMVDNKNSDDSVNLFCSSSCVMAFKVQTVSASGARLNCDSCGKNTVPAYHLAMSDTSIRNFCTLPCVMVFQEKFKKTHKQVNVFTKLPIGSTQIQSVTPTQPQQDVSKEPPKLDCSQCTRSINFKPELIQIQSDEIPKGTEQSERKRPEASGSNVEEPVSPKRKMIHNPSRVTTENMVQVVGNLLRRVKQLEEKVNTMQNMNDKLQSDNITLKVALMKKMNRKKKPPEARVATTAASEPLQNPPDNNMVDLGFGVQIPKEKLYCVSRKNYRQMTRGLMDILFTTEEMAVSSVSGKKSDYFPDSVAKPALSKNKVSAIIAFVQSHFNEIAPVVIRGTMGSKLRSVALKDKMVFVCSVDCSHEFKKANYVTSLCEYCKIEKITRDAKRINNKDCYFCSDGCKLLFRHDLTKNWGKHCHSCVYCHCMSKKLVTAQYGGSTEEFCSEDCRSKYTMLFCHVAKCDTCGRKGKLKQSLPMLGEVKHFCDLSCLLQFCSDKVATQGEVFKGTGEATPVIANVISLAGPPTGKSNASDRTAPQSTVSNFQSKNSGHVSIQTETVKPHPPSGPKILKNKALLCRPLVQNKGVSCKTQTADVEAQTDDVFPKIMVLPVPVPVYVPVPMNMYSQCTPKPVGLPLPLPVPMFLPVTMDSAERIIETIQEIKEKIPSDPFEAELILMAEMVAEQDEKNDKQERPKEKVAEKETERHEVPAADDHASTYSDDLDTDDLASFLNNWEDASSDAVLRSPSRSYAHERIIDVPVGMPSEPYSEPPPPALPPMDVEADFTVETLEKMARLREQSQQPPSPPPATPRRRQAHRKAREKKGRKSQRPSKATETPCQRGSANRPTAVEVPKLKSQYGVDAWKRWIQWRQTQPNLEKPRFGSRPMELKEDVLRCTTAELSYGLCCFITEVKRPNGEPYSPDSLFYLCLGIQQYLFENGRVENIFMDRFYNKFSTEFTSMLRGFKPSITASGYIHSRVEEEFLWDCKQLGAYSPIVLLNTLLFFCCKYFGFTTVEQHRQLSFAHVMRCTKTNQNNTKTTFLRFYPPLSINETDPEVPAKKRKEEEIKEDILEMMENTENPLRCPVRLYEFYLSKCSESVKQRTNLFYLHPERCCVPNSPLWFSSTALDDSTMEAMLIRILTVRELHLRTGKEGGIGQNDDPPFIPDEEEDEDSE